MLLISGSFRQGSTNTAVLRTAAATAGVDVVAELYAEADGLPHFNPDDDVEGAPPAPVAALRARLDAADAVLLSTPEYAGALPGSFKNLLEWTVGGTGLYRKPVAWINAAGIAAPTGGADAHDSLRKVLAYVGADVVDAACARIPVARQAIGPDGLVHDAEVVDGVTAVVAALARHAADRRGRAGSGAQ